MPLTRRQALSTMNIFLILWLIYELSSRGLGHVGHEPSPHLVKLAPISFSILYDEVVEATHEVVRRLKEHSPAQARFVDLSKEREARKLQSFLSCSVEEGVFVLDPSESRQPNSHRLPLKPRYRWVPKDCNPLPAKAKTDPDSRPSLPRLLTNGSHSRLTSDLDYHLLCDLVRGKRLLLLGDRIQYSLHNLIIDRLGFDTHQENDHTCVGAEFCNWHHICPPSPTTVAAPDTVSPQSSFEGNDPHTFRPSVTEDHALMRYAESTSFFYTTKRGARRLNEPYISPVTGIREHESYWRFWVSGSDVVVLSRGPIPAPAWSYDKGRTMQDGAFSLRPTLDKELAQLLSNISLPSFNASRSRIFGLKSSVSYSSIRVVDAAVRATFDVWLPSVLRTLDLLKRESAPGKLFIWRGEWFARSACDVMDSSSVGSEIIDTANLLGVDVNGRDVEIDDPWLAFRNVQVLLQAEILREVLPYLGIPFLPHHMHLAPFSAFMGSKGRSKLAGKIPDCLSIDPTDPDQAIDEAFLGGLARVLLWQNLKEGSPSSST